MNESPEASGVKSRREALLHSASAALVASYFVGVEAAALKDSLEAGVAVATGAVPISSFLTYISCLNWQYFHGQIEQTT